MTDQNEGSVDDLARGPMRLGSPVSVDALRRDYRSSIKAEMDRREIWTYFVARPLSFYLAALFLRLAVSANQATWLSIAVLAGGCVLLGFGSSGGALLGAALLNVWLVLDCVDGTIARYHKSFSAYGAYLDTISGYAAYALVFFAAGIGAYNRPDEVLTARLLAGGDAIDAGTWLLLGAWASIAALCSRLAYQKFKNTFDGRELRRHQVLDASPVSSWSRRLQEAGNDFLNVSGGLLAFLFLAVLLGALDLFLLVTVLGNSVVLVLTLRWLLRRAAAEDG